MTRRYGNVPDHFHQLLMYQTCTQTAVYLMVKWSQSSKTLPRYLMFIKYVRLESTGRLTRDRWKIGGGIMPSFMALKLEHNWFSPERFSASERTWPLLCQWVESERLNVVDSVDDDDTQASGNTIGTVEYERSNGLIRSSSSSHYRCLYHLLRHLRNLLFNHGKNPSVKASKWQPRDKNRLRCFVVFKPISSSDTHSLTTLAY